MSASNYFDPAAISRATVSFVEPRPENIVKPATTHPEPVEEVLIPAATPVEDIREQPYVVNVAELSDEQLLEVIRQPASDLDRILTGVDAEKLLGNDRLTAHEAEQEILKLKADINDSFAEVAGILGDLTRRFELLDQRLAEYNARASHKI